jgi:hypothetical protein
MGAGVISRVSSASHYLPGKKSHPTNNNMALSPNSPISPRSEGGDIIVSPRKELVFSAMTTLPSFHANHKKDGDPHQQQQSTEKDYWVQKKGARSTRSSWMEIEISSLIGTVAVAVVLSFSSNPYFLFISLFIKVGNSLVEFIRFITRTKRN